MLFINVSKVTVYINVSKVTVAKQLYTDAIGIRSQKSTLMIGENLESIKDTGEEDKEGASAPFPSI